MVSTSTIKSFGQWVDGAHSAGHLTGGNVKELKKAFSKAASKEKDAKVVLKNFGSRLVKMEKHFKGKDKTTAHVKNAATELLFPKEMTFDAKSWAKQYEANKQNASVQKTMLADIYKGTQKAAKNGFSVNGKQLEISPKSVKAMQEGTLIIHNPAPITIADPNKKTAVTVYNGDSIDVAIKLQQKGLKVAVLNMANAKHPGGGAKNGARAQEESIFRISNYFQSLYPDENKTLATRLAKKPYYVPEFGAIYTPGVTVFRETMDKGFAFKEPVTVDMIASAADDLGKVKKPVDYEERMLRKIGAILRVAAGTGHNAVVLGAFGCGAFKHDPKEVSKLFKRVINEKEVQSAFDEIAFAVINDHNGKGNYEAFEKTLKT